MQADTRQGIELEHVPIGALRPDAANPRRINDSGLDGLTRSISEFGLVDPIIARREDGRVIGGHQRLLAARRLGLETVPVVYLELPEEQARLLNLALNRISGEWDRELLVRLVADLDATPNIDVSLAGFEEGELRALMRSLDARERRERPESFDLSEALENAERTDAATKPGALWLLGNHGLLCGDATDPAQVGRLMSTTKAGMAFTDPPYNVDYGSQGGPGSQRRKIANDTMTPEEWDAFVQRLGRQPPQQRGRCGLRVHEHQGVAQRIARSSRG